MTTTTWKDGSIDISEFSGDNGVVVPLGSLTPNERGIYSEEYFGDFDGDGSQDRATAYSYIQNVYTSEPYPIMPGVMGTRLVITSYSEGSVRIRLNSMVINVSANLTNENIGQQVWFGDYNNDGYGDIGLFGASAIYVLFGDTLNQTEGDEFDNILTGGLGGDTLNGYDGNDILRGGGWADTLNGGAGNDLLNGGAGDDSMAGGLGDDVYRVDGLLDLVTEGFDEGYDKVFALVSGYTLTDNVEELRLVNGAANGTGNALANSLHGNQANNVLDGAGGDDVIRGYNGSDDLSGGDGDDSLIGGAGIDVLSGGEGADWLHGGVGLDIMSGGAGSDTFAFFNTDINGRGRSVDYISDFSQNDGDTIDFSGFDADRVAVGQQGFTFIGTEMFDGTAGQLRYYYDAAHDATWIRGDLDGDGSADLGIRLTGQIELTASDFNLFVPS